MSQEEPEPEEEQEDDIKYFVRVGKTDLDGTESVETALLDMNGVGRRVAKAVAVEAGVEPLETLGRLEDDEIEELKDAVQRFDEIGPSWMVNREKDRRTGDDMHIVGSDLDITREEDINRMKKIRSYRGIRHRQGKKVRGQRTKSTGRTGGEVAVKVSELQAEAEEEEEE
ncbi:MAG: 30S ribosomal protein S13 [Halobacteriales archaeon]|nr:30S ribosomal protein S13 [Halobacteriales archaeon]